MDRGRVVVRGGGDLGTGVAVRLFRCGFEIAVLEVPRPVAVRRTVAFGEAVYDGSAVVEGISAFRAESVTEAERVLRGGRIAVLVDRDAQSAAALNPWAVVDAIMAKRNVGTHADMAPLTVGLGPGFVPGVDVHAVVETNRGPHLGRVLWDRPAEPDTGIPGTVEGQGAGRVLRASCDGTLEVRRTIGDIVDNGEEVARVEGTAIVAPFRGMVRGLARSGLAVTAGMKIGDLDPRLDPSLCWLVSDKALAVAGGVVEALLTRRG